MVAVRRIQDLPPQRRIRVLTDLIAETNPLTQPKQFEDLFTAYLIALVEFRDGRG